MSRCHKSQYISTLCTVQCHCVCVSHTQCVWFLTNWIAVYKLWDFQCVSVCDSLCAYVIVRPVCVCMCDVCVCVCMFVWVYMCVSVLLCKWMHVWCVFVCFCVLVCEGVCVCICDVHVCEWVRVYVYTCVCMCVSTCL